MGELNRATQRQTDMRARLFSSVVIAFVVLAGCSPSDGNGNGGASPGNPGDPTISTLPPEPSPIEPTNPQIVEPRSGMENVHAIPFVPEDVKASGKKIRVPFWGGVAPCFVLDHYKVKETNDSVTVTLFAGNVPSLKNVACIEIAALYAVDIPLKTPLGNRIVINGELPIRDQ